MYSRHSGITVPKNYNGIRFRSPPEVTTTKEHRPIYTQSIKTAHSPLYNYEKEEQIKEDLPLDSTDDSVSLEPENDNITLEYDSCNECNNCDTFDCNEPCDGEPCSRENEPEQYDEQSKCDMQSECEVQPECDAPSSLLNSIKLPVADIIGAINKEDALLLGLILLIASEKDKDNGIILTFLTLLLLKR